MYRKSAKKRTIDRTTSDNNFMMPTRREMKLQWPISLLTQKILDYIDKQFVQKPQNKSESVILNLNTAIAYELSVPLDTPKITHLPYKILNLSKRAKFIDYIDTTIMSNVKLWDYCNKPLDLEVFLDRVAKESTINNLLNYDPCHKFTKQNKVSLALRLWCGCIDAAKLIGLTSTLTASNYSSWKITCERTISAGERRKDSLHIDILSHKDPIYCAGAEASSALKSLRKQYYSFNGVSRKSVVRRYSNRYLINTD